MTEESYASFGAYITTHKSDYELVASLGLCFPGFCLELKNIYIVSEMSRINNVAVKILVANTFLNLIIYYVLLIVPQRH